jgi:hypothetical protein
MFNKMKNGKEFPVDWKIAVIYRFVRGREREGNQEL